MSTLSATFAGMGFIEQIKTRWASMNLKPGASRHKKVMGLQRAKRVGILYEATDREMAELVRELVSEFREQQKEVSSLGFVNVKYEEEIPKSRLGLDFFGPKSLNFSLKSNDRTVLNFQSEKFDILLDLNLNASPILLHVVAESQAGFIVGAGDNGKLYRDLYFEMEAPSIQQPNREVKLKQLKTLINNIKKYATEL